MRGSARILAPLALGLATMVGVAMSCAWCVATWPNPDAGGVAAAGDRRIEFSIYASAGKSLVLWRPLRKHEAEALERTGTYPDWSGPLGDAAPPAWSSLWDQAAADRAASSRVRYGDHRWDVAAGWPMLAFKCCRETRDDPTERNGLRQVVRGGLDAPLLDHSRRTPSFWEPRAIPLTPIWSGLAIDAAFYSAIWWGLIAATVGCRRSIRRRRGLCPVCGYDTRGSAGRGCPECGHGAPSSGATTRPRPGRASV